MRKVTSIVDNATTSDFKNLSDQVLELSKTMGVDAVKAADALYQAISAGVPKENAVDFLRVATTAAIAGVTDTRSAVDGLTTIIQAFGLQMTDARTVSDAMFQAVKVGKLEFPELASSIGIAAGTAHALGVSYTELLAAGATLTLTTGSKIPEAMTMLEGAMKAVIKPTAEMEQLIEQVGFKSGSAMVQALGFEGSMNALNKAAGGSVSVLAAAFGRVEGLRGELGLTGDNAAKAKEQLEQMTHASDGAGASATTAAEVNKGFNRQLEMFEANVKAVAIEMGASLLPVLEKLLNNSKPLIADLESFAKWFGELPPGIQTTALAFTATAAAIGPLTYVAGTLISSFGTVMTAVKSITGVMGSFAGNAIPAVINGLAGLPGMIANISTAVQGNMVGALTAGETALLNLGKAGVLAAGAFAGWELGKWAEKQIPGVSTMGDVLAGVLRTLPGVSEIADGLSEAWTGAGAAARNLKQSTQDLADALFLKYGVVVDKTGLSTEEYAAKLRAAAVAAGTHADSVTKSTKAVTDQGFSLRDNNAELEKAKQQYKEVTVLVETGAASHDQLVAALERLRVASANAHKDFASEADATKVLSDAEKDLADGYKANFIPTITNVVTALESVATARDQVTGSTKTLQTAEDALAGILATKGTPNAKALVQAIADVETARAAQKTNLTSLNEAEKDLQLTQGQSATATTKIQEAESAYAEALRLTTTQAVKPYVDALAEETAARQGVVDSAKAVLDAETALQVLISGGSVKSLQDITDAEDKLEKTRVALKTSTDKLRDSQKELSSSEAATAKANQELRDDEKALDDTFTKMAPHLTSLKTGLDDVRAKKDAVRTATDSLRQSEQKLSDILGQERPSTEAVNKATSDAQQAREKLKSATDAERDSENRLQTSFGVSNDAIRKITSSSDELSQKLQNTEAALSSLGIAPQSHIQDLANKSKEAYDIISNSGLASATQVRAAQIQALKDIEAAYVASGQTVPAALQIQLAKLEQDEKDYQSNSVTRWSTTFNGIRDNISNIFTDLNHSIFEGTGSFAQKALDSLKKLGESILDAFLKPAEDAIAKFLAGAVTDLLSGKGLGGILTSLDGIGAAAKNVFGQGGVLGTSVGAAGSAAGSAGSAAGSAGSTASGAANSGGSIASTISSSLTGWISAIGDAISAVTGVIGVFQNMHQETSLNAIEHNTRYSMMYLGEREDGGILGVNFRLLDEISFGFTAKASVAMNDYLHFGLDPLVRGISTDVALGREASQQIRDHANVMDPTLTAILAAVKDLASKSSSTLSGTLTLKDSSAFIDAVAQKTAANLALQGIH